MGIAFSFVHKNIMIFLMMNDPATSLALVTVRLELVALKWRASAWRVVPSYSTGRSPDFTFLTL
jgi:hypothetical protein